MQAVTAQEWAALDEDDTRELVDGRLEAGEMPDVVHETALFWFATLLRAYFVARGGVVTGGVRLAMASTRGRQPDACVFVSRRPPARGPVDVAPDIVLEIVSPSAGDQRRDRIAKVDEYARFRVAQYWLLDPSIRVFEILALEGDRYTRALAATDGLVEVPSHPGLRVDLDALWAELDAL